MLDLSCCLKRIIHVIVLQLILYHSMTSYRDVPFHGHKWWGAWYITLMDNMHWFYMHTEIKRSGWLSKVVRYLGMCVWLSCSIEINSSVNNAIDAHVSKGVLPKSTYSSTYNESWNTHCNVTLQLSRLGWFNGYKVDMDWKASSEHDDIKLADIRVGGKIENNCSVASTTNWTIPYHVKCVKALVHIGMCVLYCYLWWWYQIPKGMLLQGVLHFSTRAFTFSIRTSVLFDHNHYPSQTRRRMFAYILKGKSSFIYATYQPCMCVTTP